jgi:hypothetical protein
MRKNRPKRFVAIQILLHADLCTAENPYLRGNEPTAEPVHLGADQESSVDRPAAEEE